MSTKLFNTLLAIVSVGITACLLLVSLSELTPKESSLLGILLTILSFIASWLVSKHFADRSHKQAIEEVKEQYLSNLRTYALNAAEKVNNLSSELAKLSVYLQQEIAEDEEDESNTEELYLSAFERIESAIHIINTLKSVNDTYLSDWKGVIGEELDERLEEQQEREHDLKQLAEKIENIIKAKPDDPKISQTEVVKIGKQISDLRKELNFAMNSVSGTFIRTPRNTSQTKKLDVVLPCPYCETELTYRQRPKVSSFKLVPCANCKHKSYAKWDDVIGFSLVKEENVEEKYSCPWCDTEIITSLSNFPHSKAISICQNCKGSSQIIRTANAKFNIHQIGSPNAAPTPVTHIKVEIDEEKLELIRQLVPDQPWEKGMHKSVAEKACLPINIVRYHISELIRRGIFKPQIDGILYEPIKK